ncbi:hypothetical protein LXL04_039147 [Taraxacum kok-saghyz]
MTDFIGVFVFRVNVGTMYSHFSPSVKYLTKFFKNLPNSVYDKHFKTFSQVCHPYIDTDENMFLSILYNDWKPVITISKVVDEFTFCSLIK